MSVSEFVKQTFWWQGPQFLKENIELRLKNEFVTDIDKKKSVIVHHTNEKEDLFLQHNSYIKLVRLFAYVMKFMLYKTKNIAEVN